MLETFATMDDARRVVQILSAQFAKHAEELSIGHAHPQGREVWTKAFWKSFEGLKNVLGPGWTLYPEKFGKGPGKAGGEFLVDLVLFDDKIGPRIACESELDPKDIKRIRWGFDKLRCVKSDIKILIFERAFEDDLPKEILEIANEYLFNFGHLHKGEIYIFTQLDRELSKHYVWQASRRGPIKNSKLSFQKIDFEMKRPAQLSGPSC